ncbi:adp-ribosylation factor-related protein 1 [Hordeum vulgare]|nr:adp-ribosylation factor-related protein 1 [Hordeum vulgare]
MGLWNYCRKGTHDREAGSLSGRRRGSVKEEAASPPRQAATPFSIAPRPGADHRDRQYFSVEIGRRRRLLPDDLYYDPRYAAGSTLCDTWLRDEHDVRRASYFVETVAGPRRAQEVRGITPTPLPSPSPSPPSPPRMTEEEEASLIQRVMEDSMATHDERQWSDLDCAMALSAAGDVAIPEPMKKEEVAAFPPELVDASWGWSCTAPEMAQAVGAVNWCPTPPRSPEREASPREEVLQASFQHAPHAPGTVGPPLDAAALRRPPSSDLESSSYVARYSSLLIVVDN